MAGYVQRRGGHAVFVARYLAAVHALTPIVAGTLGMRYRRFVAWAAAGAATGAGLYVGLGTLAGASYRQDADTVGTATYVVIGVVAGVGAFVGLVALRRRRLRGDQDTGPVEVVDV